MKKVLLITHSNDNYCVQALSDTIKEKGGLAIRFNTDFYPGEVSLSSECRGTSWSNYIHTSEGSYDLSEFESLWYRRIRIGDRLTETIDKEYIGPSVDESRKTFFGMLAALDLFKLDDPLKMEWANRKQLQLKVAQHYGLNIPGTLITNHPADIEPFFKKHEGQLITKMQASFAIYNKGKEQVVFTNSVKEDALDELDEIKYCPMTFQENIPKKLELRTIVTGNKLFTAAVNSQKFDASKDDWRKEGLSFVNDWEKFDLPKDIEKKLLQFMDHFQLNYGAIDFILTPDDKLYFLEINTAGEFYWLQKNPGFPVTEELADLLLGNAKRR